MRIKLLVGALLLAGSLHAAQSYAERAIPSSSSSTLPQPSQVGAVDFEAVIDPLPRDGADGLAEAIQRAERISAEAGAGKHQAAVPAFVQKIAEGMKARIDALTMMSSDRTFHAGEVALHKATIDLDREAEAALAEHATEKR